MPLSYGNRPAKEVPLPHFRSTIAPAAVSNSPAIFRASAGVSFTATLKDEVVMSCSLGTPLRSCRTMPSSWSRCGRNHRRQGGTGCSGCLWVWTRWPPDQRRIPHNIGDGHGV
jgi:hypothetical protein